jgi:hypothetical protein
MEPSRRVQIHQYNDPEILEFFNEQRVRYRLVGDHLFIIRSRGRDVAAGPGDWLTTAADGEAEVERGDYARRARRAIESARQAHAQRQPASRAAGTPRRKKQTRQALGAERMLTEAPRSGSRG